MYKLGRGIYTYIEGERDNDTISDLHCSLRKTTKSTLSSRFKPNFGGGKYSSEESRITKL